MCDPISLAVSSVAISAAGSGMSAYQQYQSGKAQQAAYRREATMQQEKARFEMDKIDSKYARTAGQQRALIAASGLTTGSFGDVIADSFTNAALEKKSVQYGADRAADNLRAQGDNAYESGKAGAFGTILGGFGSAIGGAARIGQMRGSTSINSPWETTVTYGA